ncbi:MAG: epoxide hydrolase N-terminal domain-containing protein, partial [Ramlibacter sp.]|nr:epoxide hydrolase N-terminal domain-containing protein [Ramlibacter sp.]
MTGIMPARRKFLAAGAALAAMVGAPAFAQAARGTTPFTYRAPQAALDVLKQRLARTRWPERETVSEWSQGVPLAKMRALVDHWRTGYNLRRCEAALARIPQFRTTLDGLGIHFIHVRFMEIVAPLTDPTAHGGRPEDAFHFVAPSLP